MKVETCCISLSELVPENLIKLDSPQSVIFVFTTSKPCLADPFMKKIESAFPKSIIMAGSTGGEIFEDNIRTEEAVLAICKMDNSKIKTININVNDSVSQYEAGKAIANSLNAPDLKGIYLLYDGSILNGTKISKGLVRILGKSEIPVIGGGSGSHNAHSEHCWVYSHGRCEKGAISAIGFYGDDIQFGWGSNDGWMAQGKDYIVTRSIDNIVLELDGRPALDVYKEAINIEDDNRIRTVCGHIPFAIVSGTSNSSRMIRSIFSVRSLQKSLVSAGDIPEGSIIQLMKATPERLIKGAERAAMMARLNASDVGLALVMSCAGRRSYLGDAAENELSVIRSHFPAETKMVGFNSWGELAPSSDGDVCAMQNQTVTIAFLKEWSAKQY